MTWTFRLTSSAIDDLDDIWNYIALDSIRAANRVESTILSACHGLARHPLLGSRRTEITDLPVRFWTVPRFPNYVVVYRPEAKPLEVIAILHGKRDIPRLSKGWGGAEGDL